MSNSIRSAEWGEVDENLCPCKGNGWANIKDDWDQCFVHYTGQLHPESRLLLLDEPLKLREEDRLSRLRWQIKQSEMIIQSLLAQLKIEYKHLRKAELELTNRTPTIKVEAVSYPPKAI